VSCCSVVPGDSETRSTSAPLLASGGLGGWSPLPGNPEKTVRDAGFTPSGEAPGRWLAGAGATIGGRAVWAIRGQTCPSGVHQCTINGGGLSWFAVCCTAAGEPTDLTSLLSHQTKAGATDLSMQVDGQGRLWLAWLDGATTPPGIALKLVQLDPATLKPLSTNVLDHTLLYDQSGAGPAGAAAFAFACGTGCHLVYSGLFGVFSWDGTGQPTTLWTSNPRRYTGGHLLGAGMRAGGLDVGSFTSTIVNGSDSYVLTLEHGDASGRGLHAVDSISVQPTLPNGPTHVLSLLGLPTTIPTPVGFVALAMYASDDASPSRVLAAVLHG
jgi:hypothetical protein